MKTAIQSLRFIIVLTLLTGVINPLVITGFAKVLFSQKADGSLIVHDGKIIGSELLAQKFEEPKYFWPRPSGADYATVASGATNKGPTSADLVKAVGERRAKLGPDAPVELLTASGSGLDPHLSPAGAKFQIARIASERKLPAEKITALVDQLTEAPQLGILGEPRVNVLALNRALNALKKYPLAARRETCYPSHMKTMSVRDIRQRWPEAEKALAEEGEIIVTRDSKPVARIVPYVAARPKKRKKAYDWDAHMRWLDEMARNEPPGLRSSDEILFEMRNKGHHVPRER